MGSENAKKSPPPHVRAFLSQAYGIKFEVDKPKDKSFRRLKTSIVSAITKNLKFGKMQKKLLRALASKDFLDTMDVRALTGTKVPKALVRDTKKAIERHPTTSQILTIEFSRIKGSYGYHFKLKFSPSKIS